ncbi:MAG TPA: hypothetical protein VMD25_11500 [Acidobacteriaceae bacterium]|nr:hypothetical protein [Acidobacteriaceae bacterium]
MNPEHRPDRKSANADPCSTPIDRNAPAGAPDSLGSKSDCGGRPTTDDSVVEAIDEEGPIATPPSGKREPR